MTIYGLGGCGKSALAIECAYRAMFQQTGRLVFWVPAISRESFELAYREIGARLRVPGITEDNADIKQLVKDALDSTITFEWLMIVDNADDSQVLMSSTNADAKMTRLVDYLPRSNRGKIVFTTRSRKAAGELTQSNKLELKDMDEAGAQQLLWRRVTNQALLCDTKAVDELLELLAYLPLAIVQAAAFIDTNDMAVSKYVSLIRDAGDEAELFGEHFEDPSRYQEMDSTIAKTWHPSTLTSTNNLALVLNSQGKYEEAEKMHRQTLAMEEKVLGAEHPSTLTSTNNLALVLNSQGKYEEAEKMHRQTLAMEEKVLGDEHPSTLTSMNNLAEVLGSQGKYEEAESMHRQTLAMREKVLGGEHPSTLTSINNLALVLGSQGKYEEAETMHRQELAISKKVLGDEHPSTLTSINNLALVLGNQGNYEEAITLYERTFTRLVKVFGQGHPHTRTCHENYSSMLASQRQCRSGSVPDGWSVGGNVPKDTESPLSRVTRKLRFKNSKS